MSKSIRIKTRPGGEDTTLNVNLEQEFDFIEILSLKISQEEVYRRFCSDYGAVVGRVIANDGFGVPNAKVSVFIPLSDEDESNEIISSIYPYKTVYDKNSDGVKYNLLPDSSQFDCHTPIGTFPSKTKILDNDDVLEVYEKYYKYTTTTNNAGDYMLFGVPLGNQMIHVDLDLSDMGILSQRPYDFIRQGHSKKSFDSPTKFSKSTNLDNLSQVVSQNMGVFVTPFWGDPENCQVGITRVDVDLNHRFEACAIFMGSIFGDSEKNAVSRRCSPRKKLGELCDTVTTEGTIEMIRKDQDGRIEPFSPEGGRVIDEDGTWAYQIPMNLEYKVTDEEGNLIPSEDPTKGIATKSRVRFKISMDQTGGEGKLRTRAKYLVPNNPLNGSTDFIFDETTPDTQFTDLFWNKLYTVRQFIPRYQKNSRGTTTRKFTGIKDVDDCGDHSPFPFNRLDTDINPLYTFLCRLMAIITTIIVVINTVLVPVINGVIAIVKLVVRGINLIINFLNKTVMKLINAIAKIINSVKKLFGGKSAKEGKELQLEPIDEPNYIPCITIECDGAQYAPGCFRTDPTCDLNSVSVKNIANGGYCAAVAKSGVDHWANDSDSQQHNFNSYIGNSCGLSVPPLPILPPGNAGYVNCIGLTLAEALNVFEFDFYNDWVNGSLYSFLLKYKKKKDGKGKFCEYDCSDSNTPGTTNFCKSSHIVDTCHGTSGLQTASVTRSSSIKDVGLIKQVDDELFYAPNNKIGNILLYATDISNLGSVLKEDFQGIPQIHPYLESTTYDRPSLTADPIDPSSPTDEIQEGIDPLLFIATCSGIFTCAIHCSNIRRVCELGVDTPATSTTIPPIDGKTVEPGLTGDYVRDVIAYLNDGRIGSQTLGSMATNFEIQPSPASPITPYNTPPPIGANYLKFREYQNGGLVLPTKNSYYFYFGIKAGASALDKANSRYFTKCEVAKRNAFILDTNVSKNVTTIGGSDGEIKITIDGGTGPYTYKVTNSAGVSQTQITNNIATFSSLGGGNYSILVIDNLGNTAIGSASISEPSGLSFSLAGSDATAAGASDGSITVSAVYGGAGDYSATISPVGGATSPINIPIGSTGLFSNLPQGSYTVTVSDNGGIAPLVTDTVVISEPIALTLNVTLDNNISCNGQSDAKITATPTGQSPLTVETFKYDSTSTTKTYGGTPYTTAASLMTLVNADNGAELESSNSTGFKISSTLINTNLGEGYYITKVTDGSGQELINPSAQHIIDPVAITATNSNKTVVTCKGGSDGSITITASGGAGGFTFSLDGAPYQAATTSTSTVSTKLFSGLGGGLYDVTVKDANGCEETVVNIAIDEPQYALALSVSTNPETTAVGTLDGSVTATASDGWDSGTTPYSYTLKLGATTISTNNTGSFSGLATGNYTVTVSDANGCTKTEAANVGQTY